MEDPVRCRAEHAYPGHPLEVWYDGHWQMVTEVLEERYTPTGKCYRVICEQTKEYNLVYDPDRDTWQVSAVGLTGNSRTKETE